MAEQADGEPKSISEPDFVNLPHAFQYSASLNCLISLSEGSGLEIYDVHSRKITSSVPLDHHKGKMKNLFFFLYTIYIFHFSVLIKIFVASLFVSLFIYFLN